MKFTTFCSVFALSLGACLPAHANDAVLTDGAVQEEQTQTVDSGEIIVTAQRRSETLQKVPASVEVVSGDQLRSAHISNLSSLQEVSPSLIVNQTSNPSNGSFTVRGIGTTVTDRGFEQSVGVYIDGVFRGRPGSALQDLLDIERVEVLRGPQTTLFGRNNAAGALNIATTLPDATKLAVYAEGTYGNYNAIEAKLSVNVPIVADKLAIRVAASESKRDGVLKALRLPEGSMNSRDRQSFRVQLYWTPTETTRVRLIGDYSQLDDNCCSYTPLFISDAVAAGEFAGYTPPGPGTRGVSPSNPAVPGTFYNPFNRVTTQGNLTNEKTWDKGVSLQVDQDFGNLTLTAIGAMRRFKSDVRVDLDGIDPPRLIYMSYPTTWISENSAEVRLQNASGGPLEFVVGAYYFDQKITDVNYLPIILDGVLIPRFNSTGVGTAESGAVFGQATYNVTDTLRVTGGLRYLTETKTAHVTVQPGTATFPGDRRVENDALMGTAVIAYQPSAAANFYLRYARGYKSAAINLLFSQNPAISSPVVNPETTDAFEAGAKLRLADGRVNANIAVYTQTINDQQVQAYNSATATFSTLNAAKVRSRGVEAELTFRPVKGITLSSGINYLDATYLSFPGAPPAAGSPLPRQDLTGATPTNAPRWTITGGVNFDQPLNDTVSLQGGVNIRHATSYYSDLPHTEAFKNGVTNFVNANLELAFSNGFGLQIWGRNLTKENIYLGGIGTPRGLGSLTAYTNEPRTYGVTLRYRY
ncbi:TonB-dependent receptor [Sphingomonas sp. MG17]|uniref:TonB-dependent receptor n=1 Tax=Sphingomonas tagetis TaxID=2949092 RepID=A0A9X2HJ98_9SPHN|nr:TonB-dependent receptor [Sphingomonas tagetis]MCP3732241.1 TonB-dependent receptor [Sphingomonas tagetis]